MCRSGGLGIKPLNLNEIGEPGEDRTPDPMVAKHVWQGNLVDFAARLATLSHGKSRPERSSCTDLVLAKLERNVRQRWQRAPHSQSYYDSLGLSVCF